MASESLITKLYFAIFAAFKEPVTLNLAQGSFKVIDFGSNRKPVLCMLLIVAFALSSVCAVMKRRRKEGRGGNVGRRKKESRLQSFQYFWAMAGPPKRRGALSLDGPACRDRCEEGDLDYCRSCQLNWLLLPHDECIRRCNVTEHWEQWQRGERIECKFIPHTQPTYLYNFTPSAVLTLTRCLTTNLFLFEKSLTAVFVVVIYLEPPSSFRRLILISVFLIHIFIHVSAHRLVPCDRAVFMHVHDKYSNVWNFTSKFQVVV